MDPSAASVPLGAYTSDWQGLVSGTEFRVAATAGCVRSLPEDILQSISGPNPLGLDVILSQLWFKPSTECAAEPMALQKRKTGGHMIKPQCKKVGLVLCLRTKKKWKKLFFALFKFATSFSSVVSLPCRHKDATVCKVTVLTLVVNTSSLWSVQKLVLLSV